LSIFCKFNSTFVSGGIAGEEKHTLTVAEMPSHNHTGWAIDTNVIIPTGILGGINSYYNTIIGYTGGSQPHNNIPPTLSIRYWRRVA